MLVVKTCVLYEDSLFLITLKSINQLNYLFATFFSDYSLTTISEKGSIINHCGSLIFQIWEATSTS